MLLKLLLRKSGDDPLVPDFTFSVERPGVLDTAFFRDVFSLRYEVYCHECGFLEAEDYRNGLESDEYDTRSVHIAAHNKDRLIVGTVRLVLAHNGDDRFTFEEHCPVFPDYRFPTRERSGEISRLVVRKSLRRRAGDSLEGVSKSFRDDPTTTASIRPQPTGKRGRNKRSNAPQIVLGLYRDMYRYSRRNNIRYWYAAMEQTLARSLAKMGFRFVPIGPETDYYGPVTPFVADLDELETTLRRENPFLAAWFHDEPITAWVLLRTLWATGLNLAGRQKPR